VRIFFLEPDTRIATILLLLILALFPIEPLFNVPFILLAVLGFVQLATRRARLRSPEYRLLIVIFFCIWIPMLASLPDAVNRVTALAKTASVPIYFLAGIYVIGSYRRFRDFHRLWTGVAAITLFWCLDALWQFWTGTDWFGIPYEGVRLTGPFLHTGRIGTILAALAPLFFEAIRHAGRRWWISPILLVPYLTTIVLAGTRTAWGWLALAMLGYLVFLLRCSPRPTGSRAQKTPFSPSAGLAAIALALGLAIYAWPGAADRLWKATEPRGEPLVGLWSGDREAFERAISWRLSIWETALNMWAAHWLNGVGPRGFQEAYRDYNPERDYYHEQLVESGSGHLTAVSPRTAHHQLLEIASETGMIGVAGYVTLMVYFLGTLRRFEGRAFRFIYPPALTLLAALFPLNGHIGFYNLYSITLIWWIIIVSAGTFAVVFREQTKCTIVNETPST